jgi:hypothetical protein
MLKSQSAGGSKLQMQTTQNSQLVETTEDFGFNTVEDKGKIK